MVANLSASDINAHSEQLLIDGTLYAFQEQTKADANVMLNGFGVIVNTLGQEMKSYLSQVDGPHDRQADYVGNGLKWPVHTESSHDSIEDRLLVQQTQHQYEIHT